MLSSSSPLSASPVAASGHVTNSSPAVHDRDQPTVRSVLFAPSSTSSLPRTSTAISSTISTSATSANHHLSLSDSNNPELLSRPSTSHLIMSSGGDGGGGDCANLPGTDSVANDLLKGGLLTTIVSSNGLNHHGSDDATQRDNFKQNNDIFAYQQSNCYLESWQPPHPDHCNPGRYNNNSNSQNDAGDCFDVTASGPVDQGSGGREINDVHIDDQHQQHFKTAISLIDHSSDTTQDELRLFNSNCNFNLISNNNNNLPNMLNLETESSSSLSLSLLEDMKNFPFPSSNIDTFDSQFRSGGTINPSTSIFSAFSDSAEMNFSHQNWPCQFTTAVAPTTLVNSVTTSASAAAAADSADSSYDSDQDSSNTNQELKKFVVDLVDSGNSTTPDGDDDLDELGAFDRASSKPRMLAENSQPAPPPIKLFSSLEDANAPNTLTAQHCNLSNSLNLQPENIPGHEEVNRTISETLHQEYSEYVTREMFTSEGIGSEPESFDGDGGDDPEMEALYRSKLEFALKLGYTEPQLCQAIRKLGYNVGQNDLLAELIAIGSRDDDLENAVGLDHDDTDEQQLDYGGEDEPESNSNNNRQKVNLSRPAFDGGSTLRSSFKCRQGPRPIVIDGSNVAISHGNKEFFSCRGIQICVDWFRAHGHKEISVFVPMWRKSVGQRFDLPIKDRELMIQLEAARILFFTPSRNVSGRLMACYDDRYILNLALKNDGIIVSNDNYRDLMSENADYQVLVAERLLMYTFVNDEFMPPDDPLGRRGPSLQEFLRFPSNVGTFGDGPESGSKAALYKKRCPYDKKCTYGNKCKYYHPGRSSQPQKSVVELIAEKAKQNLEESNKLRLRNSLPLHLTSSSVTSNELSRTASTLNTTSNGKSKKLPLARAKSSFIESSVSTTTTSSSTTLLFETRPNVKSLAASSTTSSPARSLHRKLERQLTLNPDSDPRLQQLLLTQATSQSLTSIVSSPASALSNTNCTTTNNRQHPNLHLSKSSSPLRCQNFLSVATNTSPSSTNSPIMKGKLCKTKSCGNSFDRSVKGPQQTRQQIVTNQAISQPKQQTKNSQNLNKKPIVKSNSVSMPITEFNNSGQLFVNCSNSNSIANHHNNHPNSQRNNPHHQNQYNLQFALPTPVSANGNNLPYPHHQNSIRYSGPKGGNQNHPSHNHKQSHHHHQLQQNQQSQNHQKLYHSKSFSTLSSGGAGNSFVVPNHCRVNSKSPTLTIPQPQPPKIYSKNVLLTVTTTANSSCSSVASSLSASSSSSILGPSSKQHQHQLHQLSLPLPLQSSLSPLGASHQQLYHSNPNANGFANHYNHNVVTRNVSAPESTNSVGPGGGVSNNIGFRDHQQPTNNIHKQNNYLLQNPNLYPNSLSPPSSSSLSPLSNSGTSVWPQSSSDSNGTTGAATNHLLNANQLQQQQLQQQERRNKIYFHLSSIFSADLVYRAMTELPEETNPQLICAAVLKLQQK